MTTTTTTTRRRLLAGAAAVPLLPAVAHSANLPKVEPDPAVAAYREWLTAYDARCAFDIDAPDDDPTFNALMDAEDAAVLKMANTVPTTPEGAAGQLHVLIVLSGCAEFSGDWRSPLAFEDWNYTDGRDGRCAMSLLAGLRQMGAA